MNSVTARALPVIESLRWSEFLCLVAPSFRLSEIEMLYMESNRFDRVRATWRVGVRISVVTRYT